MSQSQCYHVDHRHEHAIRNEAREVAYLDRRLAEIRREFLRRIVRGLRGRDAAGDFDHLHDRHGVHKVHADDALGAFRCRAQERDRNEGGIADQDRLGQRRLIQLAENRELEFEILCCRCDREIHVARFHRGLRFCVPALRRAARP